METLGKKAFWGAMVFVAVFVTSIVVLLADKPWPANSSLLPACRFHVARGICALPGNIRCWTVT